MPHILNQEHLEHIIKKSHDKRLLPYQANVSILHGLEAKFGLFQLKNIFAHARAEELPAALRNFLQQRWCYLKNTDMQYCHDFDSPLNYVCIEIARSLKMSLNGTTLGYLMPSLKQVSDSCYLTSPYTDEAFDLRFLVMNDDNSRLINIADVLDFAILDGTLKHNSVFAKQKRDLSVTEAHRVLTRHASVGYLFEAITDKVQHQLHGETVGAYLRRLINGLTLGNVDNNGTEHVAGAEANIAITDFNLFLSTLDTATYEKVMNAEVLYEYHSFFRGQSYTFRECWDRLLRTPSNDTNEGTYCVKIIGSEIENILGANHDLYQMTAFNDTDIISLDALSERVRLANARMLDTLKHPIERHISYGVQHENAAVIFLAERINKNRKFKLTKEEIHFFTNILYENLGSSNNNLIENCKSILIDVYRSYELDSIVEAEEIMPVPLRKLFARLDPKRSMLCVDGLFSPQGKKSRHEYATRPGCYLG